MINDWLSCIAILRALGRDGRRDAAELWRLASPWERGELICSLREQAAGSLTYVRVEARKRQRIVAGPGAFPDSVAERVRQIAEGGGRVVRRTVDLTDEEIEAIMRAQVPPEHDYDYKDDPEPDGEPIHRGSGDFLKDLGYENPDEMRVKFALANDIALAIEDRGITGSEAKALTGLTEDELSRVTQGLMGDFSVDKLQRILAVLRSATW